MGLENKLNKLMVPAMAVGLGGLTFHMIKLSDREFFPPITEHIGDFALVCTPTIISGFIAVELDKVGKKYNLPVLRKIADYLPEAVGGALATYTTLGESVMDMIPDNTVDPLDIPAVLLGAGSGYIMSKWLYQETK